MFWPWLGYWTGVTNEAGKGYGYWSGIGSCFALLSIFGIEYRKHNCHAHHCWRLAIHHVEGTPYVVCRHHHPEGLPAKATADHIRRAHLAHLVRRRELPP